MEKSIDLSSERSRAGRLGMTDRWLDEGAAVVIMGALRAVFRYDDVGLHRMPVIVCAVTLTEA
jgi:hypothetical protein